MTWKQAQAWAIKALEANIAHLTERAPAVPLTERSLPQQFEGQRLVANVQAIRGQWIEMGYFVTLNDQPPEKRENRLAIRLWRFAGQQLRFDVPEVTGEALKIDPDARLRFYYVDDAELGFAKLLLDALQRRERGPLVPDLWAQDPVDFSTPGSDLPSEFEGKQRQALAAMTSPGGSLIWGPPGTGKTRVITAAVQDAIRNNKTVLVTSHTHVAVDNVLQKLKNQPYKTGTLIRVASSSVEDKVALDIRTETDFMLDRAAAVLTNQISRLEPVQREERETQAHRLELQNALNTLNEELSRIAPEDMEALAREGEAKQGLVDAKAKLVTLVAVAGDLGAKLQRAELEAMPVTARVAALNEPEIRAKAADLSRQVAELQVTLHHNESEVDRLRTELFLSNSRASQATLEFERAGSFKRAFGKGKSRIADLEARSQAVATELATQEAACTQAAALLTQTETALAPHEASLKRWSVDTDYLRHYHAWAEPLRQDLKSREDRRDHLVRLIEGLTRDAQLPPSLACLGSAELNTLRERLSVRVSTNEQLHRVEERQRELSIERAKIQDDLTEMRSQLLREAPVIGCTLTALFTSRALLQRDFDVVIIDEVANVAAPAVIYATSKATKTVALVGDFLQNAPIVETEDPVGDESLELLRWRRDDIFALAEIEDRKSADEHPRCIALEWQYRYPSVVAELVNEFCYQGLLKSKKKSRPQDGKTIVFVDTTNMPEYTLTPQGSSWWSRGGLDVMVAIARYHQSSGDGRNVGFVTPYAAQRRHAADRARAENLAIECGTSHTFQGREVPILIFDLMIDSGSRWAAVADLKGSRRQVGAAKLLNVGITRMQEQLYLVGQWRYVETGEAAGMKALKAFKDDANFEVIEWSHMRRRLGMG